MPSDSVDTDKQFRENLLILAAFSLGLVLAAAFTHIPGSPSDWASWVQAIGSIGAILSTVAVVQWQNRTTRGAEARAANERYKNVLRAAAIVGDELCQLLAIISNSLRETQSIIAPFTSVSSMSIDVTEAIRAIALTSFDEMTSPHIVTIRRVCREVRLLEVTVHMLKPTVSELERIQMLIDSWHGYVSEARDALNTYRANLL